MGTEDRIARVTTDIDRPASRVWEALVTPAIIKQYMFGAEVESDFKVGSKITWRGEYEEKKYEDKGEIREVKKDSLLQYSHFSPLGGAEDIPENYHVVTISLEEKNNQTHVTLTQDNNPNEQAREHSKKNWQAMLDGLKKTVEGDSEQQ